MTTKTKAGRKAAPDRDAARNEYYRLVRERGNALMDRDAANERGESGKAAELEKLVSDLTERITELVKQVGIKGVGL